MGKGAAEILGHWVELIRPIFPPGADVEPVTNGWVPHYEGPFIRIGWRLTAPAEKPTKGSRIINLVVPLALIDDYCNAGEEDRAQAGSRLRQFVEQKYASFNPDHDTPAYGTPPVEPWSVPRDILNR